MGKETIHLKKFIMITPLQPILNGEDKLRLSRYEAVGNDLLRYDRDTRFPLMALINAYAQRGEEIRVIAVTPDTQAAHVHFRQLEEELAALQAEKGFVCAGPEKVTMTYAGDVNAQIELFEKLFPLFEDGDTLYACLTYGNKPMPIAELMAIQYAYRVRKDVLIGCLVYGEVDHSVEGKAPMRVFDITALAQLDELVRMLAELKVSDPAAMLKQILAL